VLSIILSGFLSAFWGAIIIGLGVFSYLYRKKVMVLIFGITLILAGILNALSLEVGWILFGAIQVFWGVTEIIMFSKLKKDKKSKPEKPMKQGKRGFVWYSLRIGLFMLILFTVLDLVVNYSDSPLAEGIFTLLWTILIFFLFIVSIIHLKKYRKKTLAIISLILSVIMITLFMMGVILEFNYEKKVDKACFNICSNSTTAFADYAYDYLNDNISDMRMECSCLDNSSAIITKQIFSIE
jgi:hypothetical protein